MSQSSLSIELALLGFLRQEPKHGYAIHQELADPAGLGPVWHIKRSRLYALLNKLEEAGYITATTEEQESRPPRKVFHLTEAGKRAFSAWVQSPVSHGRALRLEFLLKLYFARLEGKDVTARLLATQREQCHQWLATEQEVIEEERTSGHRYGRLVHEFRAGQLRAMLGWLERCQVE
ncbi:MAG: PadR family transcriptional regulator [Candidatus Promineifilaceae bacterium]|nr:PadR family transcriptional regulator [Candidatus Promineifilaceae bacterium]